MKPITAALAIAGVVAVLTGCADDAGTLGPASTGGATTPATSALVTTVPRGPTVLYEAWLVRDAVLYGAHREGEAGVRAVAARALAALTIAPTPDERRAGVSTKLSAQDKLVVAHIDQGVATVATPPSFRRGDRRTRRLREAQVVFTLTQFSNIEGVRFRAGAAIGPTLTRRSLRELLPPIVVDEPRAGATTHSPLTISGTANVFEATVSIRILDAAGKTIARTFTTATCGTGCRGDYTASVRYSVDQPQDGTVEVFEVSAKDGGPQHVVAVPVRLSRSARAPAG